MDAAAPLSGRRPRWRPPLRWLWPLALLLAVWTPEALHYRIDRTPVDAAAIPGLVALPADTVLYELASFDLGELEMLGFTPAQAMQAVTEGSLFVEGLTPQRVPVRGQPQDLDVGPPTYQLFTSGMAIERMLVQAFRENQDPRWLELATNRARRLAEHEAERRHDNRFLWNDHAVANRASALIALWRELRGRPALREAHGAWLLSFVLRTGRMLAQPGQFTVRTNHGVMQNLALLQLAAAFPALAEARDWRHTAVARLKLQLGFYISPEGVVLEHSPGYHAMGSVLTASARRLLQLNGLPAEPAIDRAADASRAVLRQLLRPDGTVPPIGNTDAGFRHRVPETGPRDGPIAWAAPPAAQEAASSAVYPAAGWAVLWDGHDGQRRAQLMATWARHVGHGHKHADEGAITWWAEGGEWLGAMGYWPYGHDLVLQTYGWRSSNAPHLPGERPTVARRTDLLSQGNAPGLHLLDMVRATEGGPQFRRQVVMLGDTGLLVLDFADGVTAGSETLWSFGTGVPLDRQAGDAVRFLSRPRGDGLRLGMALASTRTLSTRVMQGLEQPLGGWTTLRRVPTPVDAIQVTTGGPNAVTATFFHLGRAERLPDTPILAADAGPTRWQVALTAGGQSWSVARQADRVEVRRGGPQDPVAQVLQLSPPAPQVASQREALRTAYARAVEAFPPWRDLLPYRLDVSRWLVALVVLIEAALALLRWRHPAWTAHRRRPIALFLTLLWGALAVWTLRIHLVP